MAPELKAHRFLDGNSRRLALISVLASLLYFFSSSLQSRAVDSNRESIADQLVGGEFSYAVQKGDSLTSISARFGVDVSVLAAENDLSPSALLRIGQTLRIDNRHIVPGSAADGIVINIPQRMLFYHENGRLILAFPVGLGRPDWPTPTGLFRVVEKREDPVWHVPQSIQDEMDREGKIVETCVPPGPDNPLGKYWLGLSIAGYGIHGTIAPASIYRFQTHGCIRAHPDDIAKLFDKVPQGTPGILIYRRLMLASVAGNIYLEVHPDIYKKEIDGWAPLDQWLKGLSDFSIDHEVVAAIIRRQDGIAREIGVKK